MAVAPQSSRTPRLVRRGLYASLLLLLVMVARPAFHLARVALHDRPARPIVSNGAISDAGRLAPVPVSRVIEIPPDPDSAIKTIRDWQRDFSRNQLLNEDLEVTENRDPASTDILQEYFVPFDGFTDFLDEARLMVRRHQADLLNVTVRDVEADTDTFLRYADRPLVALVLLFNQPCTPSGETRMRELTRGLVDAALRAGGRYYLPYRLHATTGRFQASYPMAERFFRLKRKYDPDGVFRNELYRTYGGAAKAFKE